METVLTRQLVLTVVAIATLCSCGAGGNGAGNSDFLDSRAQPGDVGEEICAPGCESKECGPDGCGGVCGECGAGGQCLADFTCGQPSCLSEIDCSPSGLHCNLESGLCTECTNHGQCSPGVQCTESGSCQEVIGCESTLDCPGALVCHAVLGMCAACEGDEDCPELQVCGADASCHSVHPCKSDKDCKPWELICNKETGSCVDCLEDADCAYNAHCLESFCLIDACTGGQSQCNDADIVACAENGASMQVVATCGAGEYCESGKCHDQLCDPGLVWCDGNVLKECHAIGKEVVLEADCSLQGQYCVADACLDVLCPPSTVQCADDFDVGTCSVDGQSLEITPCPVATYCQDGACLDQVCYPDEKSCDGDIALTCNSKGSVLTTMDCNLADQACKAGVCTEQVCQPATLFCVDKLTQGVCAADGFSFEQGPCPEQAFCQDGQCFPWVCQPEDKTCAEDQVWECDQWGAEETFTEDCAAQELVCQDGQCVCIPACDGIQCGDDGCGGSCGVCDGAQNQCVEGQCVCTPECAGKECGPDGCGGSCGQCLQAQSQCQEGQCLCQPDCVEKQCGSDGCGGDCGVCVDEGVCIVGLCPPEGKQCNDGNSVDFDGCTGHELSEFAVNAGAAEGVSQVDLTFGSDGKALIVWREAGLDSSGTGIGGRVYTPGQPFAAEPMQINSFQLGSQARPKVASVGGSGFVVVWESPVQDGEGDGIFGQRTNSQGQKIGAEFQVNSYTAGTQEEPAVAGFPDGSFVVTWHGNGQGDDSSYGVYARPFGADGAPAGTDVLVNSWTLASQSSPAITTVGEAEVFVTWFSIQQDGFSGGIFSRRCAGTLLQMGEELQVNQTSNYNQNDPAVAGISDGRAVAVWSAYQQDGSMWGVFGQRYDQQGELTGPEMALNSHTDGSQQYPSVAVFDDGAFAVIWEGAAGFPAIDAAVRVFDAQGIALSPEQVMNYMTTGVVSETAIAIIPGTDQFVATWTSEDAAGKQAVYLRRLDKQLHGFYL